MRAVNLLPKDEGRRGRSRRANPVALVAITGGTVVATGIACMFLLARGDVADKQSQLEAKRIELSVTPKPPPGPSAAEATLASARTQRAAAVQAALEARVAWDRVLRRFALVLPEDVWLSGLTATAPDPASGGTIPAAGAPATGFTITGHTYSHDAVARLLTRLALVPDLTNVQLQNSARADASGRRVVAFTIVADVRAGATKS